MARASTAARESQVPPAYRTGPQRRVSGFQPAQRTMPPQRQVFRDERREEEDDQEAEIIDRTQGPITKSGYPDRRFKGQRDLPPPPEEERGVRARTGGVLGDMPVTIDGKPDRRFKANRALSEEELNARWLEEMNARYGSRK